MQKHRWFIALLIPALFGSVTRGQELPPDLAAVPDNALGFIHVRVADMWKGEAVKPIRAILEKAGAKYVEALDRRFVPAPSSIDRVTVILTWNKEKNEPSAVAVVTTSAAIDRDKLVKESLPKAKEVKVGDESYYFDEQLNVAVKIASDRMLIFGDDATLKSYLATKRNGTGVFAAALREAAGKSHLTVAVNLTLLPKEAFAQLPPPAQAILKDGLLQIAVETEKAPRIQARLSYANAAAADEAEKSMKEGLAFARQGLAEYKKEAEEALYRGNQDKRSALEDLPEAAAALAALGAVAQIEEILGDFPVKRDGNSLAANVEIPEGPFATAVTTAAVATGLLLPAVQKVREAANRMKSSNNLKQIGLALHNYHDTYGSMPPAAICDKKGKPLLSWRVAILPFIEQDNLYKQFKLDEPWDSEHNIKFAKTLVQVYVHPGQARPGEQHLTHYQALVGNGAAWDLKAGMKFANFTDGLSNTIWLVEAEKPVPWTKPDDINYDPKKMPPLGFHWGPMCQVGFADGSVRAISKKVPETTWHLLFQRNDGQVIPSFDK